MGQLDGHLDDCKSFKKRCQKVRLAQIAVCEFKTKQIVATIKKAPKIVRTVLNRQLKKTKKFGLRTDLTKLSKRYNR